MKAPRPPHRLERLRAWMQDESLDALVVSGADHVNYLGSYWRYYGGPSALVLARDGERTLAVMSDEVRIARELSDVDEVVPYGERGFGLDLDPFGRLAESLERMPVLARARRLGVAGETAALPELLAGRLGAELVPADAELLRLRLVKDVDELERIGASYELCWIGQRAVAEASVPGTEEIGIFTAAQSAAQLAAGEPVEFVADLLSGPNTAEVCCPIHVAGRRTVADGDAVVADVVVRAGGYWGDTAETHTVGSSPEAAALREELLSILHEAGRMLVPGATGAEVFDHIQGRILSAFPGGEFPHHGGHALGLTSFEDPHVIPSDETPLEPWMVLALEPGVYFPGRFGARVENVFVVTPGGGVELREALGRA